MSLVLVLLWVLRDVDDDAGEDWIEDDIWREVMSGWEGGDFYIYIYMCIIFYVFSWPSGRGGRMFAGGGEEGKRWR